MWVAFASEALGKGVIFAKISHRSTVEDQWFLFSFSVHFQLGLKSVSGPVWLAAIVE